MMIEIKRFADLTPQTLFAIYKLRVAVFVVEQACPYQEVDGADLTAFHLMIREPSGGLAAYARLIPEANGTVARIGRVIVAQPFRGRGLAKKLMNLAIDQSPRLIPNANKIVLAGQAYLKDFYHSFGFKDTSDGYLEDGIPHIDMAMPINQ